MIELRNVSKTFPGVQALRNVSVRFRPGEIHALLGENGAGKSTLIKIVSGVFSPDRGSVVLYEDTPYNVRSTHEAMKKGIYTVYQDLQVVPLASVAENIMLDKLRTRGKTGFIDWKAMNREAARYLRMVGLEVDPAVPINTLSIGQRQLAVIAKAISSDVKVLMLDEPTASLTDLDARHLFTVMEDLKRKGVLILFVSHILEEVLQVADRITVLRDGVFVATEDRKEMDRRKIIRYMIGREESTGVSGALSIDPDRKVLEVRNLTKEKMAYDISFALRKGEILGFYGLVGSGRTELAKIIIGKEKHDSGEILVDGKPAGIRSIHDAMTRHRIGYVTEDRRRDGLIMQGSIRTNITITVWDRIAGFLGLVSGKKEEEISGKQVADLEIKAYGIQQRVGNLSGGNQQKVNVAKWLAADSEILIIDEPTVGVDVGAKEYLANLIRDLARGGKSIILISSDMPEIIKLAERILVFSGNRIVGEIENTNHDYDKVSSEIGNCISEFQVTTAEPGGAEGRVER